MDIEKMTEALQQIIMSALRKAQEHHNPELTPEHVLSAMLEDEGLNGIWERVGADKDAMLRMANEAIERLSTTTDGGQPVLSSQLNRGYQQALDYMK